MSIRSFALAALIALFGNNISCADDGFQGFSWQTKIWEHTWHKVSEPEYVRAGTWAQRFEVRSGDCGPDPNYVAHDDCLLDRERAEMVAARHLYMGSEHWIAFSLYIPRDFKNPVPVHTVLAQIGQASGMHGKGIRTPLLQFNIIGDDLIMTYHDLQGNPDDQIDINRNYSIASLDSMRGRWTDVMLHIRFGDEDGFAQVYHNGRLRGGVKRDMVRWPVHHFIMKYGVYRAFISKYERSAKRSMPTQVVYFDEIRIGTSRDEVEFGKQVPVD